MTDDLLEQEMDLPLGYILEHATSWDEFCSETGLNPYVLQEGRATSEDIYPVTLRMMLKYELLPNPNELHNGQ